MAGHCMGAGADWEKGKQAGFIGTPLARKRLKLAKKTKEDREWLLKGPGIDNHLNKGTGQRWERAVVEWPDCREEKIGKEV